MGHEPGGRARPVRSVTPVIVTGWAEWAMFHIVGARANDKREIPCLL
jgi:hypothetical protein